MKKLLVTGGVLFAVMPAFAAPVSGLDFTDIIQPDSTETCSGADYSENSVSMQAVYLPVCSAGQYLDATNASIGSDGTVTGASCLSCTINDYCPGTAGVAIPTGVFSTLGKQNCPDGYTSNSSATQIEDCYTLCAAIDTDVLNSLHASNATSICNNGAINYPGERGAIISECATGYTKVDLVGNGSSYKYCDINEKSNGNDCATLGKGGVVEISGNNGEYTYTGSVSCAVDGMCTLTIGLGKEFGSAIINQQYSDQGTCETNCGADATWQTRIADAISRAITKSAPVPAGGGAFCVGRTIEINWGDVNIQNTCVYGSELDIPKTTPTADEGYTFIGWRPNNNQQ